MFTQIAAKIQTTEQREKCQSILEYLSVFNMPLILKKKTDNINQEIKAKVLVLEIIQGQNILN